MPTPPDDWPSVLVPLPVRFTFDPAGSLYFSVSGKYGGLNVSRDPETYIETARSLFLPSVEALNEAPGLGSRTPEAFTTLPGFPSVRDEVERWLA